MFFLFLLVFYMFFLCVGVFSFLLYSLFLFFPFLVHVSHSFVCDVLFLTVLTGLVEA